MAKRSSSAAARPSATAWRKASARANTAAVLKGGDIATAQLVVRVNGDAANQSADLQGIAGTAPRAVLLPKYESHAQLASLRAAMAQAGLPAATQVWVMIETPIGIAQVAQLLAVDQASFPLAAVVIGTNDIARLTGTSMGDGRRHLLSWLSTILIHAKARHLAVLDGVYNDFGDTEGFAAEARQGRDMGFDGKTLIHPSQVALANTSFAPSEAQVQWAQAVVAAFALPENAAKGAILNLTRALACELVQYGITMNCLSPGQIPKPGLNAFTRENFRNMVPL